LSSDQAAAIADLARRVEVHEGSPQDIEWAYAGGELILLQARPITTGDDVAPVPFDDPIPHGPWTLDSTHSRTPATPLIASMFPEAFRRGSTRLSAEYGIPFERLEIRCINGWWYVQVVPPDGKHRPLPPKPIFQVLTRLHPWFRKQNKTAQRAIAADLPTENLRAWEQEVRPPYLESIARWARLDLTVPDDAVLSSHIESVTTAAQDIFAWNMVTDASYLIPLSDLIEAGTTQWGMGLADVIALVSGFSTSEYRDALAELAANLAGDEPARRVVLDGGPDLLSRLDSEAPGFAGAYRAHLDRYGLRVLGFDLDSPTIIEHPEIELSRLLDFELSEPVSPPAPRSVPSSDRDEYERLLARARATYPIREDGESLNAAAWGALRLAALETGRRMVHRGDLEAPEHALMLTVDELRRWLADPADLRSTVQVRRGQRVWAMTNPPPATLGPESTPPEADWFPAGIRRVFGAMSLVMAHDMGDAQVDPGADGVAGSPGVHTGPVRVVHGPEEFAKVRRGDVLVCPITASPWEVLFPDLGALITEGGGILSHPAIVAREHGIPAVLAVAGATARFSDGQIVTVDGTAGTVRLHEG
jgi:pyruvate,water dikinase